MRDGFIDRQNPAPHTLAVHGGNRLLDLCVFVQNYKSKSA
jgi:hypothetical protein